jgi:hypothetical protein
MEIGPASYNTLIFEAQCLKSNDGENPEYDRALVELISYATGENIDMVRRDIFPEEKEKEMASYYLMLLTGCVEPEILGPYKTQEERDEVALALHRSGKATEEDSVVALNASPVSLDAYAYSNDFFEGD